MVRYGFTRLRDRLVASDGIARTPKEPTESVREIDPPASPGAEAPPVKQEAPQSAPQVDPRAFRDGYEPKPSDVFIAVMGVTGAGKSTFISKCTEKEVRIGHNLQACTQEVAVFLCKLSNDTNVYLVDTPGFDDTDRSDTVILKEIASWLTASYSNSIKLHGIIYLHRITDPRMQGSAKRNLLMFKKLCGVDALKNVVLATTMWERVIEDDGVERERQLSVTQDFWGYMLDNGSQIHRHYNDRESAVRLINSLIANRTAKPKVILDIQSQMVDHGKDLADTAAGQALDDEISEERKRFAKEIAETQADMREALAQRDKDAAEMLHQHQEEMNARVRRLDSEHSALKVSLERLQEERFAKMKLALEQAEQESKRTREAMLAAQQEQERRQKTLMAQLEARDEAAARQKKDLEEMQAKVDAAHKKEMEALQARLAQMSSSKPRTRSHPNANSAQALYLWPTSVTLWGDRYMMIAAFHDFTDKLKLPDGFPAARLADNNGNRYIAFGEDDAYYIHYHDENSTCWTERSLSFRTIYASAEEYLSSKQQFGCPTCVSLGPGGYYFIRTAWGVSYNVPPDAKAHLGDMSQVEHFFFGMNGAWVALKKFGARSWDLKGQYPGLEARIRDGPGVATNIRVSIHTPPSRRSRCSSALVRSQADCFPLTLAMNPLCDDQWIVLWQNGLAAYNTGESSSIDAFDFEEWCTKNFGTQWGS